MGKIKNKIITISGEPASGKSTVVKHLREKYEKMGYNVHVVSTGSIFREVITREYIKMYPERTNTNLADIQTDVEFAKKRNEIDHMIDGEMVKRGEEINSKERPNDVYIIDSRLAWKNIPDSFAIRLMVDENIAGARAFNDNTRGEEDRYKTVEDAIEKTRKRKLGEIERYKERYDVDLTNPDNYSLLVNTSYSNTDELADIIVKGEECHRMGEYFPKHWKSPALFFPTQSIAETFTESPAGYSLDDVSELIKANGFDYNAPIKAIEINDVTALEDGHHRCAGALSAGKTLVPYEVVSHEGWYSGFTSEESIYSYLKLSNIYDWEEIVKYEAKKGNIKNLEKFDITKLRTMDKYYKWLKSRDER